MFLHLSVILFTGVVCPSADTPPGQTLPWADTPWADTHLWADTLPGQTPSLGRHLPGQTPPTQCMLGYIPPSPVHAGIDMATASDGTHPTGMHSC